MTKTSTQLIKLNALPSTEGKGTKAYKLVLDYTRVDGEGEKKPTKASKFMESLTADEKALLKAAIVGTELVITKQEGKPYTNKEGRQVTPWNLTTIAAKDTWVEKPKKQWNGKQSGGGYDNLGQQIGNSVTNAVNSLGAGKTMDEYRQRALEFVLAGDWVREQVENKTPKLIPADKVDDLLATQLSPTETGEDFLDSLENIDFEF